MSSVCLLQVCLIPPMTNPCLIDADLSLDELMYSQNHFSAVLQIDRQLHAVICILIVHHANKSQDNFLFGEANENKISP